MTLNQTKLFLLQVGQDLKHFLFDKYQNKEGDKHQAEDVSLVSSNSEVDIH